MYKYIWAWIQFSPTQMEAWREYRACRKIRARHLRNTPGLDFSPDLTPGGTQYLNRLYKEDCRQRENLSKAIKRCKSLGIPNWYL